ncbi:MAG: hypothetical protein JXQ27_03005 [Acidobacteria bacterium]|nr:hypothetical protein [Acidobacteriota bacterium]
MKLKKKSASILICFLASLPMLSTGAMVHGADACACSADIRGDLNQDGNLDTLDAVLLAHYLSSNIDLPAAECADVTVDCRLDIRDLMTYMGFLGEVVEGSHAGRFIAYEGSRTCLPCHETETYEVHASLHYQWQAPTPDVVGEEGGFSGKYGTINDFCTYPNFNWIGKMTNVYGQQVDGGCAKCHIGLGKHPTPEATEDQLENIDCLVCHSDAYKRTVGTWDGELRFVPDHEKMTVSLLQAASDIRRTPSMDACLNCHTKSGGGNNFKRGDLEEAHRSATREFDVHMAAAAAGGAGLECVDCHFTEQHRIAGRGVDLRGRDLAADMSCEMCHSTAPHGNSRLDDHAARINCTVCHIPDFANVAPTDLHRDFSRPGELDPATGLYEPHMLKAAHVQPAYGFYNGKSYFYDFGTAVQTGENGHVLMAGPQGDIKTAGARIYAFKRHTATQAVDPQGRLIPLKMGIVFQTGDTQAAIEAGADAIGWGYEGHTFVETERYMGLFHEVAPSEYTLQCTDCHGSAERLDFTALGYTPLSLLDGKPLCASCHRDQSGAWGPDEYFTKVHQKHVDGKHIDCSKCHGFSSAY